MNIVDNIEWLGQCNASTCRPKRLDELDMELPYFSVSKNDMGKLEVKGFNYENHDNAPRMPYVCNFLQHSIFPYVKGDLSGYYNIQLHDTYTYLNDGKDYSNVLCFGKRKGDKGPVQIPDCYFMGDWGGKYRQIQDNIPWADKMSKIIFAGTTTGSRNPKTNERINVCLWAQDKEVCDFYITNIAQIEPKALFSEVPDFKYIYRPPIPLAEQLNYRYQLVIDGNTCRWNPDVYFTNSMAFTLPSDDMLWYYPLLCDATHYIGVTKEDILKKYSYFEANPKEAGLVTSNANRLAKQLFNLNACRLYTVALFEDIASNK